MLLGFGVWSPNSAFAIPFWGCPVLFLGFAVVLFRMSSFAAFLGLAIFECFGVQFCFLGFAVVVFFGKGGVSSFAFGGLQLSPLGCSLVILGFSSCPAGGVLFCFWGLQSFFGVVVMLCFWQFAIVVQTFWREGQGGLSQ